MKLTYEHNNINVLNLEKSIEFYTEMVGLKEVRRNAAEDGSFILVFMKDENSGHQIELTWLADKKEPYNLGDNEFHMAFRAEDFDEIYKFHKEAGVICFENTAMGIYFIADPDGYWVEILPMKK